MLQIFGINHEKTPLDIRERLSFTPQQLIEALPSLLQQKELNEVVILSTCNRTEIYTNIVDPCVVPLWLLKHKAISNIDLHAFSYMHRHDVALKHLMRVASGLDSMILGEPQILGQLKNAYATAEKQDAVGSGFKQLFPAIFAASKDIRANTSVGAQSVSLAYTIMQLVKRVFKTIENQRVLLIGAGETIGLIATHFHAQQVQSITIANRTIEKSRHFADTLQANVIPMREVPQLLREVDLVVTATASQLPLLGKGMVESAMSARSNRPLLLLDLAVPRDIEPEVAMIPNVMLYNIDDLQAIIATHKQEREMAAREAETILDAHIKAFEKKMRVFQVRHVIAKYREKLDGIRETEHEKALRQLSKGVDPALVLEEFGIQLVNKIMHHPTVKMREAASEDHCIAFQQMKALFADVN